ncbi:TIGR02117 family protein [Chitinophaga nivalis]|uniref:TIGR02117 family protein n=1 Tax=Chitinophaga nivalis TaxID=2991709 RepID=A0ABT3IPI7_9BACT|nr:TIGR02117 family protein [Chitinophaga nivalis]MCW3464428.1 TIGR02117 family protein [Chitinophaga nivalis]MCW3485881.1 TIGR02117 family protein [Chitinophaga nivalis]
MIRQLLKKSARILGITLLTFILFIAGYLLAAYILSRMSTTPEPVSDRTVAVYILTNGVHTDLVLPVRHGNTDWSSRIPFQYTARPDTLAQYIAFGWGDKGFYLETPTWADLTFRTAYRALFGLGAAAIHTTYYRQLSENDDCRRILISETQYNRLVAYISNRFLPGPDGQPMLIATHANYGSHDAFYEARGRYHLFYTCNTWANNGLKSCGQKAARWTIFDTGIFRHYPH